jgi:hypothetical protein
MKFCSHCGASILDSAVSFCSECGKPLVSSAKLTRTSKPKRRFHSSKKQNPQSSKKTISGKTKEPEEFDIPIPPDSDYDGYYDDVATDDYGKTAESMNGKFLLRIFLIAFVALIIIGVLTLSLYFF